MAGVLEDLRLAARRLRSARADFVRLTAAAFDQGCTNSQVAAATGEKTDTVRMRRVRAERRLEP